MPFIAIIQSEWQRVFLRERIGRTEVACLDATHNMNNKYWPLYTIVVPDDSGRAVPVMYMVTSSEGHGPIQITLRQLFTGPCFVPKRVVIDKSLAEIKAVTEVLGTRAPYICYFHVMQVSQVNSAASSSVHTHVHKPTSFFTPDGRRGNVGSRRSKTKLRLNCEG